MKKTIKICFIIFTLLAGVASANDGFLLYETFNASGGYQPQVGIVVNEPDAPGIYKYIVWKKYDRGKWSIETTSNGRALTFNAGADTTWYVRIQTQSVRRISGRLITTTTPFDLAPTETIRISNSIQTTAVDTLFLDQANQDVSLYRAGADTLRTDDTVYVDDNIIVTGTVDDVDVAAHDHTGGAGDGVNIPILTATTGVLTAARGGTNSESYIDGVHEDLLMWDKDVATIISSGYTAAEILATTPALHDTTHQNNGSDEISVAGLSGVLADAQTPAAHKTSHQNNGSDEISVTGLSGLLADGQTPLNHSAAKITTGTLAANVGGTNNGSLGGGDNQELLMFDNPTSTIISSGYTAAAILAAAPAAHTFSFHTGSVSVADGGTGVTSFATTGNLVKYTSGPDALHVVTTAAAVGDGTRESAAYTDTPTGLELAATLADLNDLRASYDALAVKFNSLLDKLGSGGHQLTAD